MHRDGIRLEPRIAASPSRLILVGLVDPLLTRLRTIRAASLVLF